MLRRGKYLMAVAGILLLAYGGYWLWRSLDGRTWAVMATGGDPLRAPQLFIANGCAGCHQISGVPGAVGKTGPSLSGMADRQFIGGILRNTPENLYSWIRFSRDLDPQTAMPSTNVSEQDARDMAAYLYELN
jgi:mono/diheme cytochrome c family protein